MSHKLAWCLCLLSRVCEPIESDPSLFMYAKQDEFARGQEVLHLFGETEEILLQNIANNKEKLQMKFPVDARVLHI